jgi:predicted nicotinamide N-methyase
MKNNSHETSKKKKCEIWSHGMRFLLPSHKSIRKLRKEYSPSNHGYKVWPTTWLLIDYLKNSRIINGKRIIDIACGWGLTGIFCAKIFNSKVTWVDNDKEIYPYLKLMAKTNNIETNFMHMDINKVGRNILRNIDIVIGSDICFCDSLIDPIRRFIKRAKNASVSEVYISDPGRWPFDDLAEVFIRKQGAELFDWKVTKPVNAQGKILKLSF